MAAVILKGLDLFRKGKPEDALNSLKLDLEKRVSKFGTDHISTAEVHSAIAKVLESQCKYEESLHYAKETYKKLVLAYGFTDSNTLVALRIIANIKWKQGQHDAALNIHQEVYHHQVKYSGQCHHETLMTLNNMAFILQKRGEDVLAIRKKMYNLLKDVRPSDLFTLQVRYDIAEQLSNRRQLDEALEILKEINDDYYRSRTRHLHSLKSLDLTARVLVKKGKHADALEMWEKVLRTKFESSDSHHPNTLETLILNIRYSVAFTYGFLGKFTESLNAYEQLYATEVMRNGEYHPSVLSIQNNIANVLARSGKYAESLARYEDIHKKLVFSLGETHPDTLSNERIMENIELLMSLDVTNVCNP